MAVYKVDKEREMAEEENVCCPYLAVIPCGDTEEHCHLICSASNAFLRNIFVTQFCLASFSECIGLKSSIG